MLMKKYPVFISIGLSLIIAIPAILAIFCGYQPREELTESFFLIAEEDEKGNEDWRVYENRQGREKELVSNGYGGYTGVDASEQTLYFSKKLPEKPCDSLMLEIWATFCSVSVFLDNQMIYSDFPELDNRIGWLELPTPAYEREKPLLLSLPPDYQGKTLTIAQSYIGSSEKQETDTTFYPCGLRMHYDYGYENRIIGSVLETMIPAMFFFLLSMLLLAVFIGNAFLGNLSFPVFSLALMSAMLMGRQLVLASFYHQYFGYPTLDYASIFYYCSIGGQLLFFASIFRRFKGFIWTMAGCQCLTVVLFAMAQEGILVEYVEWYSFLTGFPSLMGVVCLAAVLVCVFIQGGAERTPLCEDA